jgi:hypothetical protein
MKDQVASRLHRLLTGPLAAALIVLTAGGVAIVVYGLPHRADVSYSFMDPKLAVKPSVEPTAPAPQEPIDDVNPPTVATPVPTPSSSRDSGDPGRPRGHEKAGRSDDDSDDASESDEGDDDRSTSDAHHGDDDGDDGGEASAD